MIFNLLGTQPQWPYGWYLTFKHDATPSHHRCQFETENVVLSAHAIVTNWCCQLLCYYHLSLLLWYSFDYCSHFLQCLCALSSILMHMSSCSVPVLLSCGPKVFSIWWKAISKTCHPRIGLLTSLVWPQVHILQVLIILLVCTIPESICTPPGKNHAAPCQPASLPHCEVPIVCAFLQT